MTARKTSTKVAENQDLSQEKRRMRTILRRLHKAYPDSQCSLHFEKPLQLVLSNNMRLFDMDTFTSFQSLNSILGV